MTTQRRRVAIMAEGNFTLLNAKTATGVIRYSDHHIVGAIDSTRAGRTIEQCLGFGGPAPVVATLGELLPARPDVLLIGIAPSGGRLPDDWRGVIFEAIENHLDVWSGLHFFLTDDEEFAERAEMKGVRLWDVRRPPAGLEVAHARALKAQAFVVLTVGTDCNVGKMTVALELRRAARARGLKAEFVATGQTGILIEGEGTPLDAVPGDFMAGEVERLVMMHDAAGADVIFVEGQGALLHPGFGPVTLGLMLGAMPDAFVMVHQPSREKFRPGTSIPLPSLEFTIRHYEQFMEYYKAPRTVAVCLNTYDQSEAEARRLIAETAQITGLPCCDALRDGVEPVMDALEPLIRAKRGR